MSGSSREAVRDMCLEAPTGRFGTCQERFNLFMVLYMGVMKVLCDKEYGAGGKYGREKCGLGGGEIWRNFADAGFDGWKN